MILNLFTTLDDFALKHAENVDKENIDIIVEEAKRQIPSSMLRE